jgi:hypothetical protein
LCSRLNTISEVSVGLTLSFACWCIVSLALAEVALARGGRCRRDPGILLIDRDEIRIVGLIMVAVLRVHESHAWYISHRISRESEGFVTFLTCACLRGCSIALRSGGNGSGEESEILLRWLDVGVSIYYLRSSPTPWGVGSDRSIPDGPFLRTPHVSAVGSRLSHTGFRNLNGRGVVRRGTSCLQFPRVTLTDLEFLLLLINCLR